MLETTLTVLDEFGAFPAVIARELDRYLPFLATTKVLMAAVRKGAGREQAHEVIKDNAVSIALEMREKGSDRNELFARLAADSRLGLSATELDGLLAEPIAFTGAARAQVAAVISAVNTVLATDPEAAAYQPEPIL
jgi:adenylosuccinate lyase